MILKMSRTPRTAKHSHKTTVPQPVTAAMDLPVQGRFNVKGQEAQKIGQKDARHIRPPSAYSILQNHFEEVLQRFCQTAEGFGATSELHGRNMRHEERQIDKV